MSKKPEPPSFPEPFDSPEISSPAPNVAGSYGQRSLGPVQDSFHPSGFRSPGGATSSHVPPPYPSAHIPVHQPIPITGHIPPEFPMPPSQGTSVPIVPSFPQLPMAPRGQTMFPHGHPNNTQLAPGPYSGYSSSTSGVDRSSRQAPVMSVSQRGPGMLGPVYTTPHVQKNQDDSECSRHEVYQGIPARNLPKSPPKRPVDTVPSAVRYPRCARAGCQQFCPEGNQFCSPGCANP
ncbi:hypothetical protein EDB87DRAFT_319870 [Lactarius vividus]|nr:hypothetical protein EDB87DRAFT_319870 [Lactarius vividus]